MKMSRRGMLAGSVALGALLPMGCVPAVEASTAKKPNILFIMADDLGYADLSCYGRREYQTPVIDSLARDGMRFTHAYSNSSVCSPTRVALMTGQYQARFRVGLEEPLGEADLGLPPEHPTLPSLLGGLGYQTALIGKWHLGKLPNYGPLQSGYNHFWGIRGGGVDYFRHTSSRGEPDLWDGDVRVEEAGYMTDLLCERAVSTIKAFAANQAPFLISLHLTAPHWPWQGPDDQAESERLAEANHPRAIVHFDGGSMETYAEMVTRMDSQIARVLEALTVAGIQNDTIVIFTSDNGGERFSDNWPFLGQKSDLLEGGIRIPTIVRWPAKIAAGSVSDQVMITMDWYPTLLALAGGVPDPRYPTDGADITEGLLGAPARERTLFWRHMDLDQAACRHGDYKYLKILDNTFLFNIVEDPLERANLKLRMPDMFAALQEKYNAWNAEMLPFDPTAVSRVLPGSVLAEHYGID